MRARCLCRNSSFLSPVRDAETRRPVRAGCLLLDLCLGHVWLYAALGGGATSSGMYLSPLSSPVVPRGGAAFGCLALIGNALLSVSADFINVRETSWPPAARGARHLFTWLVIRNLELAVSSRAVDFCAG